MKQFTKSLTIVVKGWDSCFIGCETFGLERICHHTVSTPQSWVYINIADSFVRDDNGCCDRDNGSDNEKRCNCHVAKRDHVVEVSNVEGLNLVFVLFVLNYDMHNMNMNRLCVIYENLDKGMMMIYYNSPMVRARG